ncbi:MAG: YegP family protein [Clostridia bacterium]|nr:YegP family protein [Clostridia bacterium]
MGKFVIRNTKTGIKFDLKAGNGEVIATSEVYKSERSCRAGIASVAKNAPIANVEDQTVEGYKTEKCPKFEVYTDKAGEIRFRLKATNGQIIAVSEGYKAMASCTNGIASVRKNADGAPIVMQEDK